MASMLRSSATAPLPTLPLSSFPDASPLPPHSDVDLELHLSHPVYSIWGSNTGVDKTLASAGIASSTFSYIKPVQTGFPLDSDSGFVYHKVFEVFTHRQPELHLIASNYVLKASRPASEGMINGPNVEDGSEAGAEGFRELCWYEEWRVVGAGVEVMPRSCLARRCLLGRRQYRLILRQKGKGQRWMIIHLWVCCENA